MHLAATRVTAEVVVIFEDQNASLRTTLAVVVGRSETADARADHHELHSFIDRQSDNIELVPVSERMGVLQRSIVAADHRR